MKQMIPLLLCVFLMLCGCAKEEIMQPETRPHQTIPTVHTEAPGKAALPDPAFRMVLQPEASGELEQRCTDAVIDYSHTEEGYVMACYTSQTESRLKLRAKGPSATYTYDMIPGQWAVLPLSDGNGNYRITVYRNISGDRYATVMSADFSVDLQDEFAPFLRPNQYVNYLDAPVSVEKGAQLCAGLDEPLEKVAAVYHFVVETLEYDYEKAASVKSGYLPVLDQILAEEKGICFDYAALMTAMLRSQEVPCKLVVGYAGSTYHAWISVWTEENGWIDGVIFFDGHVWKRMDPTFASAGSGSEEITEFIENGTYHEKYFY